MRWTVAGLVAVAWIAFAPGFSAANAHAIRAAHRVTVRPTSGSPRTRFLINFRAPDQTGRIGTTSRRYVIEVSGPCATSRTRSVPPTRKGQRVRIKLAPRGTWCTGVYHGEVVELSSPECPPLELCPAFVVLSRTIGRFSFHVTRHGSDTVAPTFGGLQRALACTPGPQRPGQTTRFTLTWTAAHDNLTPASRIGYDVFMATMPGGEDFAHPNWSTPPGVTTFRTPGLPSHGTVYFVVRARDSAGNQDHNRVERRGIDPCY